MRAGARRPPAVPWGVGRRKPKPWARKEGVPESGRVRRKRN